MPASQATSAAAGSRAVTQVVNAQATQDGAGVSLFRAVGQAALSEVDPFLLLDEMHSDKAADYIAGFPSHPHRGFETLSYMVSGEMRHRDSQGNEGVVGSGGVQWMRAARGIIHSEIPAQTDGLLWGYQLWINLPAARKMDEPDYSDIPAEAIPTIELKNGGFIKVIAGNGIAGVPGPVVRDDVELVFLDIRLGPQSQLKQTLPVRHAVFAYVADGLVEFGNDGMNPPVALGQRQVAVFGDGNFVAANTDQSHARFLLLAAKPIGEPIVRHGPFVMNTKDEIRAAIRDYQEGSLVSKTPS